MSAENLKIDILSLFPEMFAALNYSMIGKAQENGLVSIDITNFRDFTQNKHHSVDDTPYGGGEGMLLQIDPIAKALAAVESQRGKPKRVILLDAAGRRFDHSYAVELAQEEHIAFICGHYEGFDERIRTLTTDAISLGDYVLTGGELPAMVMIDAICRHVPGVLGNTTSAVHDSYADYLLEYPQYTRPADYHGQKVPDVLLSGHHQKIAEWRLEQSVLKTARQRPDLLAHVQDDPIIKQILTKSDNNELHR